MTESMTHQELDTAIAYEDWFKKYIEPSLIEEDKKILKLLKEEFIVLKNLIFKFVGSGRSEFAKVMQEAIEINLKEQAALVNDKKIKRCKVVIGDPDAGTKDTERKGRHRHFQVVVEGEQGTGRS